MCIYLFPFFPHIKEKNIKKNQIYKINLYIKKGEKKKKRERHILINKGKDTHTQHTNTNSNIKVYIYSSYISHTYTHIYTHIFSKTIAIRIIFSNSPILFYI